MKVLVTGSSGFIGKHLMEALSRRPQFTALSFEAGDPPEKLEQGLSDADYIFHLAGVNRPPVTGDFEVGNTGLTATLCAHLKALGRRPVVILSSSVQATMDNPYGVSKRKAEDILSEWAASSGGHAVIFRLKNVFGKWCRPNYNSVVATFCHNIAHDLPITISDPSRKLELVYIDDVIEAFMSVVTPVEREVAAVQRPVCRMGEVQRSFETTLGELAATIRSFREVRRSLILPSFADEFVRALYATYLSYLDEQDFAYSLEQKTDHRGTLAEFVKSPYFGQIFVSRTKPGVTRGNHYHHTKTEKFLVLDGEAVIRFRLAQPGGGAHAGEALSPIIEHRVCGRDFRVLDIPPGYAHSIENVGETELVTLFWTSAVFDPCKPDTVSACVLI